MSKNFKAGIYTYKKIDVGTQIPCLQQLCEEVSDLKIYIYLVLYSLKPQQLPS